MTKFDFAASGLSETLLLAAIANTLLDEGLELVRVLWASNERMTYKGKHYQFEDVRITPKPVQNPIPVWSSARWKKRASATSHSPASRASAPPGP